MKKVLVLLVTVLALNLSNAQELKSENLLGVTSWQETTEYNPIKVTVNFGGRDQKMYSLKSSKKRKGTQQITMTPNQLANFRLMYLKAFDKAKEWLLISQENNVSVNKDMDIHFYTTSGWVYDVSFEKAVKATGDFHFTTYSETEAVLSCELFIHDEHYVYTAFFKFPRLNILDKESVDKFTEFMEEIKKADTIVIDKIKSSKQDLFKN